MFQTFFYQPILNLLVFLYNIVPGHDLGIAIILLTVIIKLILLPLSKKSLKSQKAMQELQPKIEELKKKYKDNREAMSKAMMALYKNNKVNPFSSCFPLIIQMPFLFAVFRVFRDGLDKNLELVYSFIDKPETIDYMSFGFIDLAEKNVYFALLAGVAQFWSSKMMMAKRPAIKSKGAKDENMMAIMNKQMLYFMPVFTVFIGLQFPGGLTLYWLVTTILMAFQQMYLLRDKEDGKKGGNNGDKKVIVGEVVK